MKKVYQLSCIERACTMDFYQEPTEDEIQKFLDWIGHGYSAEIKIIYRVK